MSQAIVVHSERNNLGMHSLLQGRRQGLKWGNFRAKDLKRERSFLVI